MKSNSIGARYTKFLVQFCLGAAFSSIAWADSEDEVIEEQRVTGSYLIKVNARAA